MSPDKTLADKAYRKLRAEILDGHLGAGQKLKLEALAKDCAVGMSPLREALARLQGDHLVVSEGQRGFWVAPLPLDEIDDVSRVRAMLETEALSASIAKGGSAWERRVKEAFERLSQFEEGMPSPGTERPAALLNAWEERNHAFHAALVSGSGSPCLTRLCEQLYQQSERYRRVSRMVSGGRRNVHEEHVAIFRAALERQTLKACRLVEDHILRTAEQIRLAMSLNELPDA
ncbi:GntR family transcriptional regulator [Aquabacter spiritensis]|uniref:GntR family transcriptional regulator n=1 Tax=Aquabacter spiritensis TaxID=933073 RepID=A0A4R3LZG7_9HYPH|nr:FCD domain-containing protein [Aquabacter spiritensis]TCT06154.1 GntR family transcriptional regulator [Aquabacter spiritensis]